MKHTKLSTLLFLLLISSQIVLAQDTTRKSSPFRFLVRGALELGGDRVAEIYFTNGESQSVRAGQGGTIAVGAQFQVPSVQKLLFQATVGFKYVTTEADNAHIRLTRIPLQLTANWMAAKKLRLGAGVVSHQAVRFKADGIGPDIDFKSATGPTFEIAYAGIGLCYTAMKYTDEASHRYSANAIGLSFTAVIPNK